MTKLYSIFAMALVAVVSLPASGTPAERAWLILQQGITSKKAGARANAAHALRLVAHNARAEGMVERALTDSNPKVRAAAARALGPMGAVSSVPKLKSLLSDREPAVVLAAAHSLYLLGDRAEVYDLDCDLLSGERKSADGAVASQLKDLRDPHALAVMGFETGIGFMPFGGEAYEAYKRLSKDDRTLVRVAAARELAADHDPKVGVALAKAASDKKWAVRAAAVYAIAKREDPTLLNAIMPLLDDKNEIVRYDTAAAVMRLSSAQSSRESESTSKEYSMINRPFTRRNLLSAGSSTAAALLAATVASAQQTKTQTGERDHSATFQGGSSSNAIPSMRRWPVRSRHSSTV